MRVSRLMDVLLAGCGLVILALPLLLIATVIRMDSGGPALFRQRRVGMNKHPFTLYKFRTMRAGCGDAALRDQIRRELRGEDTSVHGSFKLAGTGDVTRIGQLLRRTSLDELPQLINVLRGDMALVGPRPCLQWEAEMFPTEYHTRFAVRPGITGLWQVSGRSTLSTLDMLRLDVRYVGERRLGLDLAILGKTLPSMLRGGGAR